MEFLELLYLFLALVANIAYLPFIFFSDLLVTASVHLGPLLASVPVAASFYTMLALRHAGVFLFRLSVLVLQAAAFCVAYVLAVLYDWAIAQITLTAAERAYNAAVEAENARERALTAQDIRDHGPYGSRGPLFPTPVYDDVPPATFDGLPAAPPATPIVDVRRPAPKPTVAAQPFRFKRRNEFGVGQALKLAEQLAADRVADPFSFNRPYGASPGICWFS